MMNPILSGRRFKNCIGLYCCWQLLTSIAADDVVEMVSGFAAVDADKNNLLVYVDTQSENLLYQITKDSKGAVVKKVPHEYEEQNSVYPTVMAEVL